MPEEERYEIGMYVNFRVAAFDRASQRWNGGSLDDVLAEAERIYEFLMKEAPVAQG